MLERLTRNDRGRTEDALDAQEERTGILLATSSIFTKTTTWTIGLALLDYCYSPQASVFARHAYARLRTPFGRALCIALLFCTPCLPGSYARYTLYHTLHLLPYGLPHRRSRILHLRISASPVPNLLYSYLHAFMLNRARTGTSHLSHAHITYCTHVPIPIHSHNTHLHSSPGPRSWQIQPR